MSSFDVFMWGVFGGVAAELATLSHFYTRPNVKVPSRYKDRIFWIVRCGLVAVGGGLAVAYGIDKAMAAIHIGAATPLIITALAQTAPSLPEIDNKNQEQDSQRSLPND